jgi:hypothetical protein
LLYKIPLASLIITLDTTLWLIIIVGMAGPMLLSGIYEAVLDVRILTFLRYRTQGSEMTVRSWAHLLLTALLGNLELNPAWTHASTAVAHLPNYNVTVESSSPAGARGAVDSPVTPETLTSSSPTALLTATDEASLSQSSTIKDNAGTQIEFSANICLQIETTKTQLNAMLDAQTSFGSSVGVAVIFYTGSFVYALIEVQSQYGSKWVEIVLQILGGEDEKKNWQPVQLYCLYNFIWHVLDDYPACRYHKQPITCWEQTGLTATLHRTQYSTWHLIALSRFTMLKFTGCLLEYRQRFLLVLMTYIGWWYQRHIRAQFYDMVSRIDESDEFRQGF